MDDAMDERGRTMSEIAAQIAPTWERIAPTWEQRRDFVEAVSAPVRDWMLRELAPQPGEQVLEVAAGVGDTGFEAAAMVGEGGRLISTDFSPTMVDAARRRGAELGLRNVDYRVADAADTGIDDGSVDGVLCRCAYMLMPDPAAALGEARRVLRPGGRLALAVWSGPDRNPFFTTLAVALVGRGVIDPPDPTEPGLFSMADAEHVEAMLGAAGFDSVRTEEVAVRFGVPGAEEYVAIAADTAGPIAMALQELSREDRESLTDELREAIAGFTAQNGYELPGVALCAAAR